MAGYVIYSLDWGKFQQFVNNPSQEQLLAFGRVLSWYLDEGDGQFGKGDPVGDWPRQPEELSELVKRRLALPDWYADLSCEGSYVWESALSTFCSDERSDDMGFAVESDGVYWDVIATALVHHNIPSRHITESVLSHFGARPYRSHPPSPQPGCLSLLLIFSVFYRPVWVPNHSMHTPAEVQELLKQLKAVGPTIEKSGDEDEIRDYAELMPAVEKVANEGRMLFIAVDT